jgi:hypothetical protein
LMDGHLAIKSKPSRGTTIHVRVPIVSNTQPPQEISTPAGEQEMHEKPV